MYTYAMGLLNLSSVSYMYISIKEFYATHIILSLISRFLFKINTVCENGIWE